MSLDRIEARARALGLAATRFGDAVQVLVRDRKSELVRLDVRLVNEVLTCSAVVVFAGPMSVLHNLLDNARAIELQLFEAATR